MAFGLDIYRYQTVYNWNKVRAAGVKFIIVKLTDGNGRAIVPGDGQVSGSHSVGIPVGGYHFAQKGDPVRQANVFKAELDRLRSRFGAWGVFPALDIENSGGVTWSGAEARGFAIAFCREVIRYSPRVLLYANSSELRAMDATRIVNEVPGVYIWEANYGNNNGVRHSLPANGWAPRRAIHQYTSNGVVPGITERTDLNDGNLDIILMEGDDVSAEDVMNYPIPVRVEDGEEAKPPVPFGAMQMHNNYAIWKGLRELSYLRAEVAALSQQTRPVTLSKEDRDSMVADLRGTLVGALADELDARQRDGNPATGPVLNT